MWGHRSQQAELCTVRGHHPLSHPKTSPRGAASCEGAPLSEGLSHRADWAQGATAPVSPVIPMGTATSSLRPGCRPGWGTAQSPKPVGLQTQGPASAGRRASPEDAGSRRGQLSPRGCQWATRSLTFNESPGVCQTTSAGPQGPRIPLAVGRRKPELGDGGSTPVQPTRALEDLACPHGWGHSPDPGWRGQRSGLAAPVVRRSPAAALLRSGAFLPLGDFVIENICPC